MAFEPQRQKDPRWAFSTKKQTNMATVLADADLTLSVPLVGDAFPQETRQYRSDIDMTGKGHEYPSKDQHREVTRDVAFTRGFQGNSLILAWAHAFAMGKISSVQPNAGGNPTAWRHTISPFDPLVTGSKLVPVTTIYDESVNAVAGWQSKIRGCAVESVRLRSRVGDLWTIEMDIVSSGERVADPAALPAMTTTFALDMQNTVFKIGPQGAAVDISERLLEFEISFRQNIDLPNGYFPGSGLYRGRLWVGDRRMSARFVLFLDAANSDIIDLVRNNTLREISIKASGDTIGAGPEKHDCQVLFPAVRIGQAPLGERDGKLIYQVDVPEDVIYKDASASVTDPIQVIVTNTTAAFLN